MHSIVLQSATLADIRPLHASVFKEELSDEAISARSVKAPLEYFVALRDSENVVGYVIIQQRKESCHIWMLGILDACRGQGIGSAILEQLESHASKHNLHRLSLSTFTHRKEMLGLAIRSGYRIVRTETGQYGDGVKLRLEKPIKRKREVRVLLTNKCNFRCFFCHSEGIDPGTNPEKAGPEQIVDYIRQAGSLGFDDVTFSGGEPLLRADCFLRVLELLAQDAAPPDVTLVTNGSLLSQAIVSEMGKYPGALKVHVSLHSLDDRTFGNVTSKPGAFRTVLRNIRHATEAGIRVKLNCVILAGVNDTIEQIGSYLRTAADELHVSAVKFLELMVLRDNQDQYAYFRSAESIVASLEELGCSMVKETGRVRCLVNSRDPSLKIEVTRLTCRIGCANCIRVRDRTLGPSLDYYPCFIHSDRPVAVRSPAELADAFRRGNEIIAEYAQEYGDDSPILVKQEAFEKSRAHAFFEIPLAWEEAREWLESHRFAVAKQRRFTTFECTPKQCSSEWRTGTKTLKFGCDTHTPCKVEFIFARNFRQMCEGWVCWRQEFLADGPPPHCAGIESARAIMQALDFEIGDGVDHDIVEYRRGQDVVSVGHLHGRCHLKIEDTCLFSPVVRELIEQLEAQNISTPFEVWQLVVTSQQSCTSSGDTIDPATYSGRCS